MFKNTHKEHDYLTLEDGLKYINKQIKTKQEEKYFDINQINFHTFKLQEIRLKMEKSKQEILTEINDIFDTLMKDINNRKEEVINEINFTFEEETKKIREKEFIWETKEEVIKNIIELKLQQKDELLLINCKNILEGLEFLSEPLTIEKYYPYIDVNTEFCCDLSKIKCKIINKDPRFLIEIDSSSISQLFDDFIKISKGVSMAVKC